MLEDELQRGELEPVHQNKLTPWTYDSQSHRAEKDDCIICDA
jgi:hypothetical protein